MPTWCWAAAGSSRRPCLPEGNLEFLLFSSLEGFQSTCVFFEQRAQSRQIGLPAAQEIDLTRRQVVHPRELGTFEEIGDGLGGIQALFPAAIRPREPCLGIRHGAGHHPLTVRILEDDGFAAVSEEAKHRGGDRWVAHASVRVEDAVNRAPALRNHEFPDVPADVCLHVDRKSTRLNSSHLVISYAVFCLKK